MRSLLFITQHNGIRIEEVAAALIAVAGGVLFITGVVPGSRRAGGLLCGLCLAAAGVLAIVGLHWGHLVK